MQVVSVWSTLGKWKTTCSDVLPPLAPRPTLFPLNEQRSFLLHRVLDDDVHCRTSITLALQDESPLMDSFHAMRQYRHTTGSATF